MQPLPANGQAQTLPAKWVIKRTPENYQMVNTWATAHCPGKEIYRSDSGYIHSEPMFDHSVTYPLCDFKAADGFTLITDAQFKAMVEGEAKPAKPTYKLGARYIVRWEYFGEVHEAEVIYNFHPFLGENVFFTEENDSYLFESQVLEANLTLTQPNSVVGERKPNLSDGYHNRMKIIDAYNLLEETDHVDEAAALKAKHPEIWPVDYAAIVLEEAVKWYDLNYEFTPKDESLAVAVRNYLNNQK